jgi:hypothetical protein
MVEIDSKRCIKECGNCELGKRLFRTVSLQEFETTLLTYTDPEGISHDRIISIVHPPIPKTVVVFSEYTNMVMRCCKFSGKHPHIVRDYGQCVNPNSFKAKSQEKSD